MSSLSDTRESIVHILGNFWTDVFLDSDFVDSFAGSFAVPFDRLNSEASELGAYLSRHKIPAVGKEDARIFLFSEESEDVASDRYGDEGLVYGGGRLYGQGAYSTENRRFPIGTGLSPAFLSTSVNGLGTILKLGADYLVRDGYITFFDDPFDLAGLSVNPRSVSTGAVVRDFFLWGFQVEEDMNAICNFFGTMAGIFVQPEAKAREAVQIAWDLRVDGATARNTKRILCLLTDTDYVASDGEVVDIFEEGDRLIVETSDAVYSAPASATASVTVGSSIQKGDTIFDSYSVHSGNEPVPFESFEGLVLNQDYLPSIPGSLMFVNNRVDVERNRAADWFTIEST